MKILIIGGDARFSIVGECLLKEGHDVYAYKNASENMKKQSDLSSVSQFDTVILPLPVSRDGVHINTPDFPDEKIVISDLFERIPKNKTLLVGKISRAHKDKAKDFGLRVIDYYEKEFFTDENAYITAEGALNLAANEQKKTIRHSSHLIIGGGRIARYLLLLLRGYGARVTLLARNSHDLRWAYVMGGLPIDLFGESEDIERAMAECDVIYNTVPEITIPDSACEYIKNGTVYIELVGDEKLITPLLSQKCAYTVCAKALPSKYAPESAGMLLYKTISEIIKERVNEK